MKGRILLLTAFCLLVMAAMAAPVSRQQAQQKAQNFMQSMGVNRELSAVQETLGKMKANGQGELLYVFNAADEGGFVIISGDDQTVSVLGYATKGSFDYDRLPCNARAWIDGYAEQIRLIQQKGAMKSQPFMANHAPITPMLTCKWNQEAPFNNDCPDFFSYGKSVTGCVATAFAQILYYHRNSSPINSTQAEITAYDCSTNWNGLGKIHVDAVPAGSPIDWNNMIDNYNYGAGTAAQKQAVASLMRYCGASVRMEYRNSTNGGSSANEISVASAAKKYFGFRADADIRYHHNMTDAEWDAAIYAELTAGRPVLMSGQTSSGGGHAFVCDGYNNSMYHINWGWGGLGDAYFVLSNLDPTEQGVGGSVGAYNNNQAMLVNMEPGDGTSYETSMMTTRALELTENSKEERIYNGNAAVLGFSFSYANGTPDRNAFDLGLAAYKDGTMKEIVIYGSSDVLDMTQWISYSGYCAVGNGWQNGTYEIWPVSRISGSSDWKKNGGADNLHYVATVTTDKIVFSVVGQSETPSEPEYDPIIVTVNSVSRGYGDANPSFTYTVSGGTLNGQPAISCVATPTSPVGTYDIVVTTGSVTNENVTFVNGTLTIDKAPLIISAGTYTMMQGEPLPDFTLSYEGFKNGETNAVLTKQPTVSCDATESSAPGEYPVVVSGAEAQNYAIGYVNGKLIVTESPSFTLTYLVDGATYKTYSLKEGDVITPEPEPEVRDGYLFSGWSEIPEVMPDHDVIVTGTFELHFNVGHVVNVLNFIMWGNATPEDMELYDMNHDGVLNIGDVILIVRNILDHGGSLLSAPRNSTNLMTGLTRYTAAQFELKTGDANVKNIRLVENMEQSHRLMYRQIDAETYAVVIYSQSNELLMPDNDDIIVVETDGDSSEVMSIRNITVATPTGETASYKGLQVATGIQQIESIGSTAVIYDLKGHRLSGSRKGINIINGKKTVVR